MDNLQLNTESLTVLDDLTDDEKKVLDLISTEGTPALKVFKMASSLGIQMPLPTIKDLVDNNKDLVRKEKIDGILTFFRK